VKKYVCWLNNWIIIAAVFSSNILLHSIIKLQQRESVGWWSTGKLLTCRNSSALMWLDDCWSRYDVEDDSGNRPPNSAVFVRRPSAVGCLGCEVVRMSTSKSLRCLDTVVETSRSGLITELSLDTSSACRWVFRLSAFNSRCIAFALFFFCCCSNFLSDAAVLCNLALAVCADDWLLWTDVSTRCAALVTGLEALAAVLTAGKPAPASVHAHQSNTLRNL